MDTQDKRAYALRYYFSKGDARLHRPCELRASLELAMRRVYKRQNDRLVQLQQAAERVVQRHPSRIRSRLLRALRRRFQAAFRYGANYSKTIVELTGCSVEQLRKHLESLWQPGMSWENYGFAGWHIDHKEPCASFNLFDESERRACFHFSNLQPLWAKQNFDKRDNVCHSVFNK